MKLLFFNAFRLLSKKKLGQVYITAASKKKLVIMSLKPLILQTADIG